MADPVEGDRHCADARETLQKMLNTYNHENPWLGITASVALLQMNVAQLAYASRTRPDYDLRCDDCGAAHIIDCSLPSAVWNAIAENREDVLPGAKGIGMKEVGLLCPLCIDVRLQKAQLIVKAEFYYAGTNLHSKLYNESQGDVERLEREKLFLVASHRDTIRSRDREWAKAIWPTAEPEQREGTTPEQAYEVLSEVELGTKTAVEKMRLKIKRLRVVATTLNKVIREKRWQQDRKRLARLMENTERLVTEVRKTTDIGDGWKWVKIPSVTEQVSTPVHKIYPQPKIDPNVKLGLHAPVDPVFINPIPMLLWCPICHFRHVDKGEFETKPHHSHACQECGSVWRPALVNTVGVMYLPGFQDQVS